MIIQYSDQLSELFVELENARHIISSTGKRRLLLRSLGTEYKMTAEAITTIPRTYNQTVENLSYAERI